MDHHNYGKYLPKKYWWWWLWIISGIITRLFIGSLIMLRAKINKIRALTLILLFLFLFQLPCPPWEHLIFSGSSEKSILTLPSKRMLLRKNKIVFSLTTTSPKEKLGCLPVARYLGGGLHLSPSVLICLALGLFIKRMFFKIVQIAFFIRPFSASKQKHSKENSLKAEWVTDWLAEDWHSPGTLVRQWCESSCMKAVKDLVYPKV